MNTIIRVPGWDSDMLQALASDALSQARDAGATSAEVGVSLSDGLSVTMRMGEVDTLEHYRDRSLAITVYRGQCKGSATTNDFSASAVRDAVAAACSIASFTAEDKYAGLADAELMATEVADLDLYHPWQIDAQQAIELAGQCEAAALQTEGITNSDGATVTRYGAYAVYANSHGFNGGFAGSRHSITCSVIGGRDDAMQRDYWYSSARNPASLETAVDIGHRAAQRTLARLGARKIKTCEAPVLFAPEMARSLLGNFVAAIRGSALYRKSTFLLDHKGKKIFPSFVDIAEQPRLPGALGSAPFDNEGVATFDRQLVADGVLLDYVLDSYSARRLGLRTTANAGGVRNVTIRPGVSDQAALLQSMGSGLLLTEMMGQGINLVTGDYSRGASGFWVENGEIQFPVEEITVAGNLRDMFANLVAIGNDVDTRGNIRTGSLLVDRMTIAGA